MAIEEGRPRFDAGDVLDHDDLNGIVLRTVMGFDTASDRPDGTATGELSFLYDADRLDIWNGTAWVAALEDLSETPLAVPHGFGFIPAREPSSDTGGLAGCWTTAQIFKAIDDGLL